MDWVINIKEHGSDGFSGLGCRGGFFFEGSAGGNAGIRGFCILSAQGSFYGVDDTVVVQD